ncbi:MULTISPECIES: bifunctional adenosylcobinamide kinase/adenosylcobinamide-phosphate guanylyltransferase [Clostridium]|uniref:Adenosylcobinamide kinase n=2 Tax=Clostridium TaxID=1485 RepID=A0A174F924_9CLOT|nr:MULTISPECIES: bifunctional adenosylcobinamide kinase/adenosylcobinamide-phosphate guanylyltransferase [Clostridium]MBX9184704.1 adenosylcobinamide kinase/adenosylcobinamide-phosphate guanylyltransferase [Clostridium sp. K04]CUO45448.1 adenosylcobinamide-phosphate guanylyltransferase CobU [Clostridium disporicum]
MIVLVVGGAKSGKSMFAQNLSKSLNESLKNPINGQLDGEIEREVGKLYYVATMNPYDLEDLKRIENHLREREGYGFNTIEETLNMSKVSSLIKEEDTVLIDSITSLVTNYMFRGKEFYKDVSDDILSGILEIINNSKNVVIVSDYLFSDSIQYDCYTENFRKEIGVVNRKLAKIADTVVECSYGNIIYHKGKVI